MMTTLNYCTLTTPSIHIAALSFLINWNEKRCSESNILTMDHKLVLENSSSAHVYTLQITITYWCRIQQFLGGAGFSMNVVKRKTIVQLGSLGRHCKSGVQGQNPGNFWLFCILNSSKHRSLGSATRNADKSLHQKSTLLSIWGFEFGIPNPYPSFKIALDTALPISRP